MVYLTAERALREENVSDYEDPIQALMVPTNQRKEPQDQTRNNDANEDANADEPATTPVNDHTVEVKDRKKIEELMEP